MTALDSVTLEVFAPDDTRSLLAALGIADRLGVRASDSPTSGFRAVTVSLVVGQPSTVDALAGTALEHGAVGVKRVTRSFWGYGGVLRLTDGTLLKVASSSKKDSGPATRAVDDVVVLLGADDVAASKAFYVERGLVVAKSFGRKYVEFARGDAPVTLALLGRKALAKDAGVGVEGSGSHRVVFAGSGPAATDPDGFVWETTTGAI